MRLKLRISTVGNEDSSFAEVFEITKDSCTIGRRGADVALGDTSCSRRHAMLYQGVKGELRLMDLHSTNGTFVGDERVIDRPIAVGARFRIAAMQILIEEYEPKGVNGGPSVYTPSEEEPTETQTVAFTPLTLDEPAPAAKAERPSPPPLRK